MNTVKQLALALIHEIIEEKRSANRVPRFATALEINQRLNGAISELLAEGAVSQHLSSVNQIPAYATPEASGQPPL